MPMIPSLAHGPMLLHRSVRRLLRNSQNWYGAILLRREDALNPSSPRDLFRKPPPTFREHALGLCRPRAPVMSKRTLAVSAAIVLAATPAGAQFYKGKTLTLLVNYDVGGNIDTEARILARHLPKHIAGSPTIVIQNTPGAGGLHAMNLLGLNIKSRSDGLTAGFFTISPTAPLPERQPHAARDDVGDDLGLVGRQRARGQVDLVLLERLVDVAGRRESGHRLIGQVHDLEREPDAGVVRGAAAVAAEIDLRRLADVGRLLQDRKGVPAGIGDGPAGGAADRHVVLPQLDLERGVVDQRGGRADGEEAGGQSVGARLDVEPEQVHGVQPAGARRVLDHDGGAACN